MTNNLTTSDQWKDYLQAGQKNSVLAILDFGKRIFEYKEACPSKQGGSTFSSDIKDWLGMSPQLANYWIGIGGGNETLKCYFRLLPQSMKSIYQLTTLSDEQFQIGVDEKVINPEATQKDIQDFKRRLNPPKQEPEPIPDPDAKFLVQQKKLKENLAYYKKHKRLLPDTISALKDCTLLSEIKDIGYEICRLNMEEIYNEAEEEAMPKTKPKPEEEPPYIEDDRELAQEWDQSIKNAAEEALQKALALKEDIHTREEACLAAGSLIYRLNNPKLDKAVIRLLKQYTHPDKNKEVDQELFIYLTAIGKIL